MTDPFDPNQPDPPRAGKSTSSDTFIGGWWSEEPSVKNEANITVVENISVPDDYVAVPRRQRDVLVLGCAALAGGIVGGLLAVLT